MCPHPTRPDIMQPFRPQAVVSRFPNRRRLSWLPPAMLRFLLANRQSLHPRPAMCRHHKALSMGLRHCPTHSQALSATSQTDGTLGVRTLLLADLFVTSITLQGMSSFFFLLRSRMLTRPDLALCHHHVFQTLHTTSRSTTSLNPRCVCHCRLRARLNSCPTRRRLHHRRFSRILDAV